MKLYITVLFIVLSFTVHADTCKNHKTGALLSKDFCDDQYAIQNMYQLLKEDSVLASQEGEEYMRTQLATAAVLGLTLSMDEQTSATINELATAGGRGILGYYISGIFQNVALGLEKDTRTALVTRTAKMMLAVLNDHRALYEYGSSIEQILTTAEQKYIGQGKKLLTLRLPEDVVYIQMNVLKPGETNRMLRNLDAEVEKNGPVRELILDFKNVPGGLLPEAQLYAGTFLPKGTIIAHFRDGSKPEDEIRSETENGELEMLPLAVLSNAVSASAAEVVMAAFQDHERGVVVGQTTYGKGSIQHAYDLSNGSVFVFTSGLYVSPHARIIDGIGITPDIPVAPTDPACTLADGVEYDATICAAHKYLTSHRTQ